MQSWIIYTIIYAIINGFFQCSKKKATEKNSIFEVLSFFSLIGFIFVAFTSKNVFDIDLNKIFIIFIKSLVIVFSWIFALYAMSKMPISLYSVINLSRIIFSITLSVIILGEQLTFSIILGTVIIILGLILVNKLSNKRDNKEADLKIIFILLVSCLLNSISAIIDKQLLRSINAEQLQFWFLFFLTVCYWIIMLIKNKKIDIKKLKKNYWILVAAVCLIVGDRFLFAANEIADSKVSIMTLIKRLAVIEEILLGKLIFKEKNITKKLLCSILIIIGILLTI